MDSELEVVHLLVRENLADDQRTDAELGRVVQLGLESDERPTNESIQTDSELTKKMVVKWDNLEVHNGLEYRRLDSHIPSTPTMLQLLVLRCRVSVSETRQRGTSYANAIPAPSADTLVLKGPLFKCSVGSIGQPGRPT